MEILTVNKDASIKRIETEYQKALNYAKGEVEQGFSNFTLNVKGSYRECHEVLRMLEPHGIKCTERGFSHYGNGSDGQAVIKVRVEL